jgi:small GTP-binding protein
MAPMYYRGAKAAICVFDVTNEESFNRVVAWLRDLKNHADPNVVVCLAGNKCDKPSTFNLASCEELANSMGATFIPTSALTGQGVDQAFETLSRKIAETHKAKKSDNRDMDILRLNAAPQETKKEKGGCC